MKIITISIANWIDRPRGWAWLIGRGRVTRGYGQITPDRHGVGQTGVTERTNRSRSEMRPRPIQFACDRLGRGGAREGVARQWKIEDRGVQPVTRGSGQRAAADRKLVQPRIAAELDN